MGQEIDTIHFQSRDFQRFHDRLEQETLLLAECLTDARMSRRAHTAGLEAEAWLTDSDGRALAENDRFLAALKEPLVVPELARFNIELNVPPANLAGLGLDSLEQALAALWRRCQALARDMDAMTLLIGILPTLRNSDLSLANMSPLNRFKALNEQVLRARLGQPLVLDITGQEHLHLQHHDVMLESAATSFQLHWQLPADLIPRYFNASIAMSCATVAVAANSPFLFQKSLWEESRIPLFEQAVEVGGFEGAARGPVRRVTFGAGYVKHSLHELFRENLEHYPALLPICADTPAERFVHARLHNGTIWRWNRPLIGFDDDGCPHTRIEHRVMAAGPSIVDQISNAAFYYGATHWLTQNIDDLEARIPFSAAKLNFYAAARRGLDAHVQWLDGDSLSLKKVILDRLLPAAEQGLRDLNVDDALISKYLHTVETRIRRERTGSHWQRAFIDKHGKDFRAMTLVYAQHQATGTPVHEWDI